VGKCLELPDPELLALAFEWGAAGYKNRRKGGKATDEERDAFETIMRLTEQFEPEEYKLARRCQDIYNRHRAAGRGNGAHHFAEFVDEVMTHGGDQTLLDINSDFFVPMFVAAARDLGGFDRRVVALRELVTRVEASVVDLEELYAESKREQAERAERYKQEELEKPEPKDKTSSEWRHWKLRHVEHALDGDDPKEFQAAVLFISELVGEMLATIKPGHTGTARSILASLIMERQERQRAEKKAARKSTKKGKARKERGAS